MAMQVRDSVVRSTPVREWVGGQGRKLVYLHGFEQHPGGAAFLGKLAEGRQVLAPEHPGFGASGGSEHIDGLIDLVLHYRDYLEGCAQGGQVDLMGHSLGGMFAAEIAAICPDLVGKLVLVDAYGLWLDEHPQPDPFAILPDDFAAAKWADPGNWADKEPNSFDGEAEHYIYYRSQNLGAASKFMWPLPDRGLSGRLERIRAETLIIHGAHDGFVPLAYAEAFAEGIPNARTVIISDAGHMPMIEAEAAFLDAVSDFLD